MVRDKGLKGEMRDDGVAGTVEIDGICSHVGTAGSGQCRKFCQIRRKTLTDLKLLPHISKAFAELASGIQYRLFDSVIEMMVLSTVQHILGRIVNNGTVFVRLR